MTIPWSKGIILYYTVLLLHYKGMGNLGGCRDLVHWGEKVGKPKPKWNWIWPGILKYKKNSFRDVGDKRQPTEKVSPLLNEVGDLVTQGMEKAEVPSAFFPQMAPMRAEEADKGNCKATLDNLWSWQLEKYSKTGGKKMSCLSSRIWQEGPWEQQAS